jgi:hypothetical protein
MATTGTNGGQSAPTDDTAAAEEAFKATVQRAFALGWHVAELRYLPKDVRVSPQQGDPLPPAPDLDFPTRARLLIAQISADLDWLGLEPSGGMRALGATGAQSDQESAATPVLEPIEIPAFTEPDVPDAERVAESLHRPILLRLTVRNAELGKAYSLGVGLARTVLEAYEETQQVFNAAAAGTGSGPTLDLVKQCVTKGFTEDRVRSLWSEIKDLKSRFPPYAADPIAAGVADWRQWAISGQTRRGQPSDSDQLLTATSRLRRQGQIWRALLSGERKPTDVLLTANYIDGATDLVQKYASLVVRMLGANIGTALVAVFAAAVLGVAVIVLQRLNSSGFTWIAGLLAALGVTSASVLAAVKTIAARAEQALWQTELTAAIGVAINYVPAIPDNSEVEKLRDDNPGPNKGPVVVPPSKPITPPPTTPEPAASPPPQ